MRLEELEEKAYGILDILVPTIAMVFFAILILGLMAFGYYILRSLVEGPCKG